MKRILSTLLVIPVLLLASSIAFAKNLPYAKIASCYYRSYAHEQHKHFAQAIKDLEPVYATYPKTYTVNYRLGWLYYLDKDYSRALEHLHKALAIVPGSLEARNTVTLVAAAQKDWRRVEGESLRVIRIDPYNLIANTWYSRSLRMRHRYRRAIKVDRKMLAVFPTSATFLQELGINLFREHKRKESAAVFYNLEILSPANPTATAYLKKLR